MRIYARALFFVYKKSRKLSHHQHAQLQLIHLRKLSEGVLLLRLLHESKIFSV